MWHVQSVYFKNQVLFLATLWCSTWLGKLAGDSFWLISRLLNEQKRDTNRCLKTSRMLYKSYQVYQVSCYTDNKENIIKVCISFIELPN